MIPFGLASLMTVSLPIGRRATKCLVPGASAIYLFNEGSGTVLRDYSGNAYHGTLGATGAAPTWTAAGLSFDGGDSVALGALAALASGAPFTIALVATEASGGSTGCVFSMQSGSSTGAYGVFVNNTPARKFSINLFDADGSRTLRWIESAVYTAGTAVCLTATFDGTALTLYMNGALVSAITTGFSPFAAGTAALGKYSYSASSIPYLGTISAGMVYPFALSAGQVAQNTAALAGIVQPRGVSW